MIRVHYHLGIEEVGSKLVECINDCKEFLLGGGVVGLRLIKGLAGVLDGV